MSRKPVSIVDDARRLRHLLGMIEDAAANAPAPITAEAMERAGFTAREETLPDRFRGRRIMAWWQEREARRDPITGRLRRKTRDSV